MKRSKQPTKQPIRDNSVKWFGCFPSCTLPWFWFYSESSIDELHSEEPKHCTRHCGWFLWSWKIQFGQLIPPPPRGFRLDILCFSFFLIFLFFLISFPLNGQVVLSAQNFHNLFVHGKSMRSHQSRDAYCKQNGAKFHGDTSCLWHSERTRKGIFCATISFPGKNTTQLLFYKFCFAADQKFINHITSFSVSFPDLLYIWLCVVQLCFHRVVGSKIKVQANWPPWTSPKKKHNQPNMNIWFSNEMLKTQADCLSELHPQGGNAPMEPRSQQIWQWWIDVVEQIMPKCFKMESYPHDHKGLLWHD